MARNLLLGMLLSISLFSCAGASRRDRGEPSLAPRAPESGSQARSCRPMTSEERSRVLSIADPTNFPATRYRKGPNANRGIEKETDCSHFVHEVYRRAGLPYDFRSTADLGSSREFDVLPESEAQPGDLMLFRGHVGIVDEKGKIISALVTRRRHRRKSSIAAIDRRFFKTFHGQRYVLRYRCPPAEPVGNRTLANERHKP